MSTFGSTTEKEISAVKDVEIKDGDMKTVAQLRGAMQDIHNAKLSLNEKATVEGCLAEVSVVKQQIATQAEQMSRLIGMYGTLQAKFDQFETQRIKELTVRINGGSTTPEDIDGPNIRPRN